MLTDPATKLEALLESERAELMAGRFAGAETRSAAKLQLMNIIVADGAPADQIARIRAKAEANGRLLRAMASGIRSVMERLENANKTATTYDPFGRRSNLPTGSSPRGTRA